MDHEASLYLADSYRRVHDLHSPKNGTILTYLSLEANILSLSEVEIHADIEIIFAHVADEVVLILHLQIDGRDASFQTVRLHTGLGNMKR